MNVRGLWMTIKTFSNEAVQKPNKGLGTPPRMWMPRTFDPKGVRRNRFGHSKVFSSIFYFIFLIFLLSIIPNRKVNCFGHLSNRDQNNWTGYLMPPRKRLIIIYTDKNITIIFEHSFSEDVIAAASCPYIILFIIYIPAR